MTLDKHRLITDIETLWDNSVIPHLFDYIKIPAKSPVFDSDWEENGYLDQAAKHLSKWCDQQQLDNYRLSIERVSGRTPLIFIEIGQVNSPDSGTILMYGHLDKQPEMEGWDDDKGPWRPKLIGDKLYGRGAADDGYAIYSAITAIKSLQNQSVACSRCVIIIEASEEGGSVDLPYYVDQLKDRIGEPAIVICLDSGCGNYEQLWITTSLRGVITGEITVRLLREGIHSGNGSGVVASSFRVMRSLLDRIEDAKTGAILIDELYAEIPKTRVDQARIVAGVLAQDLTDSFPLIRGVEPVSSDTLELILNRAWRPSLSYIGADGFPKPADSGNVLRPSSTMKLSFRIPPTVECQSIADTIKRTLEKTPPYKANVEFKILECGNGWNAPDLSENLKTAISKASQDFFGKEALYMGEGCAIPFMNMLRKRYQNARFIITGVLGPLSNAHGANEFLHLPAAKRITCCIASIIADHSG